MLAVRRFLIPSKDWSVRVFTLYVFIILDYIMTGIFCKESADEANALLRAFMLYFNNIPISLLVFVIAFYGLIYVLLCYLTNSRWDRFRGLNLFSLLSEYRHPLFDVVFGLGVASRHFEGGMSWIMPLSNRLWLALGFVLYLVLVHIVTLKVSVS